MYTAQTLSRLSQGIKNNARAEEPAYVVWQPESGPPTVVMATAEHATSEAERLAKSAPGKPFFVLRVLSVSEVQQPAITTRLPDARELPF